MYDNEKVLKASDQRDIVWFVSSACYLRRHWPECFGRYFLFYWRNRCSTRRSCSKADQRLPLVSFSFVKKTFLWIICSVIFKSVQSATCSQNEAFTSELKFRTNSPRLGYLYPTFNNLASHAGVFRGARISSLPTNTCSKEDNIPFPLLYSRGK